MRKTCRKHVSKVTYPIIRNSTNSKKETSSTLNTLSIIYYLKTIFRGFFCEYDCGIFSCTFTEKQTYAIRTMDQKSRFVRSFGSKDKDLTVQGFIKDCLYNIKIP